MNKQRRKLNQSDEMNNRSLEIIIDTQNEYQYSSNSNYT